MFVFLPSYFSGHLKFLEVIQSNMKELIIVVIIWVETHH